MIAGVLVMLAWGAIAGTTLALLLVLNHQRTSRQRDFWLKESGT
jgi:hypothetical protein